jgi:hypothetical protein
MIRRTASVLILTAVTVAVHGMTDPPLSRQMEDADAAWQGGDYTTALQSYSKILAAPGGDAFFDRIALQTGELFQTRELTRDGRSPRFSPDGRYLAFETGLEVSRVTRVVKNDSSLALVAELPGVAASFSPRSAKVAYLKLTSDPELTKAVAALDAAPLAAPDRAQLIQALTWLGQTHSTLVVRDLQTQQETELPTPPLAKTGVAFAADGTNVFFLGARENEAATRTDIYVASPGTPATMLVDLPGVKSAPIVEPRGAALLYTTPAQSPFRPPVTEGAGRGGGGRGGGRGGGGNAGGPGGGGQQQTFALVDLATRNVTSIPGTAAAFSPDGRMLTYLARQGNETALMFGAVGAPAASIKKTTDRLDAPSVSLDNRRVAYQMMTRDDWEIYVSDADGQNERRLTREIQHDVLPRFISPTTLLAEMGEPRHRRSYLYDTETGARTRLFHNNTVRTIAPEYQWVASPDGTRLLIGAERDGDTVSPERGVYLVDLSRKISKDDLVARLNANLEAETSLKANGTRAFQPIAADVKSVLSRASISRVFGYEKALFDFDSKHVSRPGNKRAIEFLFETYKSFGYEPEYQWFDTRGALDGKTSNVIATLRGTTNPELVYVVSSHFDSVAGGPGADDDTSGTAALLEAARMLAGHPMPATIVFASFTGEEAGLLGSREFVRRAVEQKMKIVGALNNDMVGWSNDDRLDNTIRYSNAGIRDIQHGAAMLFTKLILYDALYYKSTDAAAYYEAYGDIVGGIGSYPVLGSPHYHQSHDLLEYENHELITETSKTTVATLMLLASSPSRLTDLKLEKSTGKSVIATWTPSPEKAVASYIVAYGPAADPLRKRVTVTAPRATIPVLEPESVVSVKAVNAKGLEGWDWARATW